MYNIFTFRFRRVTLLEVNPASDGCANVHARLPIDDQKGTACQKLRNFWCMWRFKGL